MDALKAGCPLCPLARPKAAVPSSEGLVITEEVAQVLEISAEWLDWRLCLAHEKEFDAKKKKFSNPSAGFEPKPSKKQKRTSGDSKSNLSNQPPKKLCVGDAVPRDEKLRNNCEKVENVEDTQRDTRTEGVIVPSVELQSIGLFESCFPERNGTPRQGMLVPSSRGLLRLRR